jgi:iron complex outermembrane recepter protein
MLNRFLLIILFTSIACWANAQTITGTIADEAKLNAIANATVTLKVKGENKVYRATSTNANGKFELDKLDVGAYTLEVSFVGFENKQKNINFAGKNLNVDTIFISNSSKKLKDVIITKSKEVAKVNVDKKVFNVAQDATANGGSAGDILKNVPGLIVDPNSGSIQIRGSSNITLLVDGKPSSIFGDDVASALQGIPGSSIESVEVIDKPGAKYDAQGKGGIVNIILKKDRKAGYNGSMGLTVGLPKKINGNVAFNANVKKWIFFINANARYAESFIKDTIRRTNKNNDTSFLNYAYTNRAPYSAFANFGFDFNLNKFNKFSLSESIFGADMKGDITTTTNTLANKILQNYNQRINFYNGHPRALTTTFGYKKTFRKPGKEWNVDASYSARKYRRESEFETLFFDANNTRLPYSLSTSIPVKGGNNNLTISSDYIVPLSADSKIELGVKGIFFAFRSENFPRTSISNGNIFDDVLLKNKFNFTQNTQAAYANYKSKWNRFNYQLGMRYEYFTYDGRIEQFNQPVSATYSNLFPSAYVNTKLNTKSDITLSYTKRVNRPNFFQLIPYLDVTNPQDTTSGNANLKPEFVHATELSYVYNFGKQNSILASLYYQYNSNLIQQLKRFNADGTSFSQPQNLAFGATYGAEFNWKHYISKIWDANLNINAFNLLLNQTEGTPNRNGFGAFAKVISNYKLKSIWDLQIAANYFAPTTITQGYIKAYSNVDVAIKRNFMKNALTLTLSGNDIFNTSQTVSIFNTIPAYDQTNFRKNQTRQVSIGAQLRFLSKGSKPGDARPKTFGKDGKEVKKDTKNRDENLKKEEGGEGEGGGR